MQLLLRLPIFCGPANTVPCPAPLLLPHPQLMGSSGPQLTKVTALSASVSRTSWQPWKAGVGGIGGC